MGQYYDLLWSYWTSVSRDYLLFAFYTVGYFIVDHVILFDSVSRDILRRNENHDFWIFAGLFKRLFLCTIVYVFLQFGRITSYTCTSVIRVNVSPESGRARTRRKPGNWFSYRTRPTFFFLCFSFSSHFPPHAQK